MNEIEMTCEQALKRLAAFLDRELEQSEAEHVQHHLQRCKSCYSRAEFERRLKTQLGELRSESVSSGLEQRIRSILQSY